MQTSYEHYGVECGSGWKGLYEPLIELCEVRGITILQVKEKFGGLRFYTSGGDSIDKLIDAAEAHSFHVCEDCGEDGIEGFDYFVMGKTTPIFKATRGPETPSGRWIKTLCEPCRAKRTGVDSGT